MIAKPKGCEGCPLYKKGRGFVPDSIPNGAQYVMVGEAPGAGEVAQGVPFVGQAGFVLKEWGIRAVPDIAIAPIGYANVLRCLPPKVHGRAYPQGKERAAAEVHCRVYDKWPGDATFVLLGEMPQRLLFGPELHQEDVLDRRAGRELKGVFGRVGRERVVGETRYIFAPHPSAVLRQPALVQHLQRALEIASGAQKIFESKRVDNMRIFL